MPGGIVPVTSGNNSVSFRQGGRTHQVRGFSAASGYSLAAGLGTVNAAAFVPELARLRPARASYSRRWPRSSHSDNSARSALCPLFRAGGPPVRMRHHVDVMRCDVGHFPVQARPEGRGPDRPNVVKPQVHHPLTPPDVVKP